MTNIITGSIFLGMNKKDAILSELRKSFGFSQTDIANRLGVSRPTYVLIESRKRELTVSQAELLSHLYSVSIETIQKGKTSDSEFSTNEDVVTTQIPTPYGTFSFGVWNQPKGEEVVFMTTPTIDPTKPVLVRVHSECMTGDIFHSYRCDCGEQKDASLHMIAESGNGVLIYLRQEGRGIGLYEKIKAYNLQDKGYDTHEANILLGHKPDYREYSWVRKVLNHLGVQQIRLITNNPSKVTNVARLGITVVDRVPLIIESNQHNRRYFETKRQKFKHFFGNNEGNYFYQFSGTESPEQVEEIGTFVAGFTKDPQVKICIGASADSHTLENAHALKNLEAIFKASGHYESFVPILHFTFKYSDNPKADIALIRKKMPYVKYMQLNDVDPKEYLDVIQYANKFFLTDIPLDDRSFELIHNKEFVDEIVKHKSFIALDNSKGSGKQESKNAYISKIDQLLKLGINDIAVYGGFGPGSLETYFDLCNHYKINFSIDAESRLKTDGRLDTKKVRQYLSKLMSHTL